jgi:hypothetical protein
MKFVLQKLLASIFAVTILVGCSKSNTESGSSGGTTNPSPSSNWDSMVWDQGKWQ